jgi:hypothetical protein
MHATQFEEIIQQFAGHWDRTLTQEEVRLYFSALGSLPIEKLRNALTVCAAACSTLPRPFEIKRRADAVAQLVSAIATADATERERERALCCQYHRYYPDSNGRGDGHWKYLESCPKCRFHAGKKDPPCPPGVDPDYHRWSIGRDTRKPVDTHSNVDYLESCKLNIRDAIARWKFAKHVTDTAEKDSEAYRRAMCERVALRSEIESWKGHRDYYQKMVDLDCAAARVAADARGDRVPGEDDGDAW